MWLAWVERWTALANGLPVDADINEMPFGLKLGD